MSSETINYFGWSIIVQPLGSGWKALVYQPGSTLAEQTIPHSMNRADRELVIDNAKALIDKTRNSRL